MSPAKADGGQAARGFSVSLRWLQSAHRLSVVQVEQLSTLGSMLVTDDLAPTTVRDPRGVRDDHLADALAALALPALANPGVIADLGSGAGVPGLPLAVALPSCTVFLVEGNGRKCEFIARAAAAMGLRNVEVVHGRAETWRAGLERCDVVTARALAPLPVVAEYAAPLLQVGGSLVAWRGRRDLDEEARAERAAGVLGLSPLEPVRVRPYEGAENRHLHVMVKQRTTPPRFPRRDGVARKRPLGES